MSDEKLDALLEAMAENTTTLIDVQKQAAATSASAKDSRTYVQNIARQTDWASNGKAIAIILTEALEEDHEALHAARDASKEMRGLSVELTRKTDRAAEAQMEGASKLHAAAQRLSEAQERLEAGKWRRLGGMALIGGLTASLGLFGGYWWAKGNLRKERLAEVGELLKSPSGEDFCSDMGSTVLESDNNGIYCASWIKRPTE